jgi:hypothetical protein
VAGGLELAIRLRLHDHAPQQVAIGLALYQQASHQLRCDDLSGAGEEGWEEGWEVLGGCGGSGSSCLGM